MALPCIAFPTIGNDRPADWTPSIGSVDVALRRADLIISSYSNRLGRKVDQVAYS